MCQFFQILSFWDVLHLTSKLHALRNFSFLNKFRAKIWMFEPIQTTKCRKMGLNCRISKNDSHFRVKQNSLSLSYYWTIWKVWYRVSNVRILIIINECPSVCCAIFTQKLFRRFWWNFACGLSINRWRF